MNINPFKLFDPSYLFDMRPGSEFMYFWPLMIFFVLTILGSFWIKRRELVFKLREFGALGLALTFLRDQNIPYLGSRLWLVLLFIGTLIYAVWYWKKAEKQAGEGEQIKVQENTVDKYLPKRKKKR